jgi:hypothetical protein
MSLNSAYQELKKRLSLGSAHEQDIMFDSLSDFLQEESATSLESKIAPFIFQARQIIDPGCRAKVEEVLFFLFRKIAPSEQCHVLQKINQEINEMAGFPSSMISTIMLFEQSHHLSAEEDLLIKKDDKFNFLREVLKKIDPYEDVELTNDEVKQVFSQLQELASRLENPSEFLIYFFNDFLVRSCPNQGYVWAAD